MQRNLLRKNPCMPASMQRKLPAQRLLDACMEGQNMRATLCGPPDLASPATHPLRKSGPNARELARAQVDPSKMQTKS